MPTVLIADDCAVQTQLLSAYLRKKGFNVLVAMDALQAWTVTLRDRPDAVILDINMPGGSGLDVLKRIKLNNKTTQIPVIVITANAQLDQQGANGLGAAEFLKKPVDLEKLCVILSRLGLQVAPVSAPATAPAASAVPPKTDTPPPANPPNRPSGPSVIIATYPEACQVGPLSGIRRRTLGRGRCRVRWSARGICKQSRKEP